MSRREARPLRRGHHGRFARASFSMALAWVLSGMLLGAVALSTDGEFTRLKVMTVLSGSMRPTLGVGDLIIARVVPAKEIVAGDIVTYQDPVKDRHVTHRVQSIVWNGSLADVVTRGDANNVGENWVVTEGGMLGRVTFHVPYLGYAIGALSTVTGRLVITGAAALLGVYALLLIWRPRREDISTMVIERWAALEPPSTSSDWTDPSSVPPASELISPRLAEPRQVPATETPPVGFDAALR